MTQFEDSVGTKLGLSRDHVERLRKCLNKKTITEQRHPAHVLTTPAALSMPLLSNELKQSINNSEIRNKKDGDG